VDGAHPLRTRHIYAAPCAPAAQALDGDSMRPMAAVHFLDRALA
jgi:hypothetical protein